MEAVHSIKNRRWLVAVLALLGVVVVLQVAILVQRVERPAPSHSGFFVLEPQPQSWWRRMKARVIPARHASSPAAALTPNAVWDDFRQFDDMHARINRMFEDAFENSTLFPPPGPAAASNLSAGSSAPFDPLAHMQHMRRQIDAMFANARGSAPAAGIGFEDGWADLVVTPGLNVTDTGDVYQVTLQLPGFDKSRIRVTLDGSLLDIVAERRQDASSASQSGGTWTSRSASRFERRLRLPQADPRPGAVKATYQDDVLRITVPKTASGEAGAGQIPVI